MYRRTIHIFQSRAIWTATALGMMLRAWPARAQEPAGPRIEDAPLGVQMRQGILDLGLSLRGGNASDAETIIGTVLGAVFTFLAVIFFILIVYGGFTWMTSAGNENKIGKAKNLIIASVIGLAIVLVSYIFTVFIITLLRR